MDIRNDWLKTRKHILIPFANELDIEEEIHALKREQTRLDMRSAYGDSLVEAGLKYPEIVCVGADTTDSLKTKNFGNKFPNDFITWE